MAMFESVHRDRVVGSLAMFDRMTFKGHLMRLYRPGGVRVMLWNLGCPLIQLSVWTKAATEALCVHAQRSAEASPWLTGPARDPQAPSRRPGARSPRCRQRCRTSRKPCQRALRSRAVQWGHGRSQAVEEEWRRKGATLSDKTARKEFGLTQDEIEAAIDAGELQYRVGVVHGNPWLRLLRREVEALMESTYNDREHRHRRAKAELAGVERDLKQLRTEIAALEGHRAKLLADLRE